jgi:hypothetical protein
MAVPTSNVGISSIYSEANGSSPGSGSNITASDLFKKSYFQGPGPIGSGTISYRAWGEYGSTNGADRIYGLTAGNADNSLGDFIGLTYYYDNSSYKVAAKLQNTKQPPPYPPPPPFYNNGVAVEVWLYDSTGTYAYIASGAINTNPGDNFTQTLSFGTEPIIAIGYWIVRFTVNDTFPAGGANVFISINGTSYVSGQNAPSNAQTTFSYSTYGSAPVASTGQGYTGLYFDIQIG